MRRGRALVALGALALAVPGCGAPAGGPPAAPVATTTAPFAGHGSAGQVPTYLAADAAPLPAGRFSLVRIPIPPFAHVFRAGDRIRVVVSAPGGDRPAWVFATPATNGSVVDTVSLGGARASALVLPVIAGPPPDSAPVCPSLRGEPCRSACRRTTGASRASQRGARVTPGARGAEGAPVG